MSKKENIRIVTIESPYDSWDNPLVPKLFLAMAAMKLRGYKAEYAYGVLPLDTYDFIAMHHLLCVERDDGYEPIMGFKTTTLSRAKRFQVDFGGIALVKGARAPEHLRILNREVERCEMTGREIAYAASWTMDPRFRMESEEKQRLQEIFRRMFVAGHVCHGIQECVAGGVVRFKMWRYLDFWGFRPLQENGEQLGDIQVPILQNETVRVVHAKGFSEESISDALKLGDLWEKRIIISARATGVDKAAA